MKVLVTGANGYLGSGIVKSLLDDGHEVVATDIATDYIDDRAHKIASNIFELDESSLYEYFKEPDVLIHLAWRNGFVHNAETHITDLAAHYNFLKAMFKTPVKSVSVMGSMHEIGWYEGCIKDETPCNPQSLYGISKNSLRMMMPLICEGKDYKWLRGYYIVGSSTNGASIFSKIVKAASEGQKTFPFTTGKNQYDFLDYEDFCNMVAKAATQSEVSGIINICSGNPESLASRVERFILDLNLDIKLDYGVYPDRKYDSKAIWGDNTKIEQICK